MHGTVHACVLCNAPLSLNQSTNGSNYIRRFHDQPQALVYIWMEEANERSKSCFKADMNCNIHTIKAAFRPISCSTQQIDLQTCGNGTICSCAHTMQVCTPITTGMYSCLMYLVRVVLSEDGAMYAAASLATSAIPDKVLCCKFVYHTSKVSVGRVNIGYAWFSPVCINRMLYSVPGSAGLHISSQQIWH